MTKNKGWKNESQRHSMAKRGIRTRKDTCSEAANLKMDDEVYKLRRETMKYIYEAKQLCNLPRITIRIIDKPNDKHTLGLARMNDNIIWIPKDTIKNKWDLRFIVYHEILHAVFGIEHNKNCPLMNGIVPNKKMSKKELDKIFIKIVKKSGGECYE